MSSSYRESTVLLFSECRGTRYIHISLLLSKSIVSTTNYGKSENSSHNLTISPFSTNGKHLCHPPLRLSG